MRHCRIDGCREPGDQAFGLALMPEGVDGEPAKADGKICQEHAVELWKIIGPRPKDLATAIADELTAPFVENESTQAVVIRMDRTRVGQ